MSARSGSKSGESQAVMVRVSGKEVQVGCAPGEENDVIRAAKVVDQVMQELRQRTSTSTTEKVAILTAINFANELYKTGSADFDSKALGERVEALTQQIDEALNA